MLFLDKILEGHTQFPARCAAFNDADERAAEQRLLMQVLAEFAEVADREIERAVL